MFVPSPPVTSWPTRGMCTLVSKHRNEGFKGRCLAHSRCSGNLSVPVLVCVYVVVGGGSRGGFHVKGSLGGDLVNWGARGRDLPKPEFV